MKKEKKTTRLKLLIFFLSIFVWNTTMSAQNSIAISGTVEDEMGPLPGVSVSIKGTATGTLTDLDGRFSINVPDEKTNLSFSFVGYVTQDVAVGSTRDFKIVMKTDDYSLEEVVVVGYGTMRKKDLTGATASISGSKIKEIPVTTAAQAITGKVAGVNVVTQSGAPGADINITIRGGTSITQGTEPLYIVDGFQMENGLRNIDINDIESIDVMKDASSTAIYGARGANGVILITTKSGKSGKTQINYNAYLSFEKLGKKLDMLSVEDYVKYQYEFQTLGGKEQKWIDMFQTGADISDPSFYSGAYDYIAGEYRNRAGIDWQDLMFGDTGVMQNHNLSVTGGTDKTKFMLSYNFTGQDGIMNKTGYDRNSIRAKINHEIAKGIRLDFNSSFQNTTVEGGGSLGGRLKMSLLQPITGGTRFTNEEMINTDLRTEMEAIDSQYDIQNPMIVNDAITSKQYTRQAMVNAGLEFDFLNDFTFRTAGNYFWQQVRDDFFDDGRTKTAENNKGPYGSRNNSERSTWQFTNTLTWKKSFDKHSLNIMLGQETWWSETMKLDNTYFEFPPTNLGLNDVSMAGKVQTYTSGKGTDKLVSLFGRASYNYDSRYLVTATIRGDGSSRFSKEHQWGYFPSASAAWRISEEAFMNDYKSLFSNLKLRVGYGITGNNNINRGVYTTEYESTFYAINNKQVVGLKTGDILENPTLKWESTSTTNIGLDIGLFNNRLNLTAEYYNNKSDDLLIQNKIPSSTGYNWQFQNLGAIRNRGFEFMLNTVNIRTKDFTWTTDLNISFNKSKVLDLYGDANDNNYFLQNYDSRIDFKIEKGQPLGQFYGYKYDGVYTTDDFTQNADGSYMLKDGIASLKGKKRETIKPGDVKYIPTAGEVDADGNPVWSTNDRTVIGNAEPDFTGGITNTFMYKGFDLSIFMNFAVGHKLFNMNSQRFIGPYLPNQNSLQKMASRFALIDPATGKETTNLARLAEMNPNQHSSSAMWSLNSPNNIAITDALDYYLEDASFLRINNITLGYTLPANLTRKAFINNARIYFTLNNIHTFTDYSGYDPEVSATSSALTRGVDNSAYPRAKSYVIGLNLTF